MKSQFTFFRHKKEFSPLLDHKISNIKRICLCSCREIEKRHWKIKCRYKNNWMPELTKGTGDK